MTTADYLNQLEQDREDLVDNLEAKGITGLSGDETFTQLVPEVLNIPSGSGGPDWSAIGYSDTPSGIFDIYNYSKNISDNWENVANLQSKFFSDKNLVIFPLVNTSNATTMQSMFDGADHLTNIPLLNTTNVENFSRTFYNCAKIKEIPQFDTSSGVNFTRMFYGCSSLKIVPLLDTHNVGSTSSYHQNIFTNCSNLSNESLNNILKMCINMTNVSSNMTLAYIGLSSTQATTCQTLSNYQDFIDAGWTIGY